MPRSKGSPYPWWEEVWIIVTGRLECAVCGCVDLWTASNRATYSDVAQRPTCRDARSYGYLARPPTCICPPMTFSYHPAMSGCVPRKAKNLCAWSRCWCFFFEFARILTWFVDSQQFEKIEFIVSSCLDFLIWNSDAQLNIFSVLFHSLAQSRFSRTYTPAFCTHTISRILLFCVVKLHIFHITQRLV